jgi:hypothetical protein
MKVDKIRHVEFLGAEIPVIILGAALASIGYLLMLYQNVFSIGLEDSVRVYYGLDVWIMWPAGSALFSELDIPLVVLPLVPLSLLSGGLLKAAKNTIAVALIYSFVINSYHLLALEFPLKPVVIGFVMTPLYLIKLLPLVAIITAMIESVKRYRLITRLSSEQREL